MANWLSGYTTRKKITIDYTKIDDDLTDFPVLVKLTSSNFDFSKANSDGFDVRFTSDNGTTLLKYERERHDATNKLAEYWVKIPSVSSSADTDFFIYFRSLDTDDGADPTNVWDSNFKGVWHMKDLTTSTIEDSTSNNNDGTKGSAGNPTEADGKIAKGQNYDANTETIELGNVLGWERTQSVTIEAWGKHTTTDKYSQILSKQLSSSHQGWSLYKGNNGDGHKLVWLIVNTWTSNAIVKRGSTALNDNTWHYLVGTYDGSSSANGAKLYVDCVEESYTTVYNSLTASILTSATASIGNRDTPATLNQGWEGTLDEVRISYVARSSAWIKASYYSGNNSLVSYGSEEAIITNRRRLLII